LVFGCKNELSHPRLGLSVSRKVGGAVARNSKNRAAAVRFLEYLASDSAQTYFANGNNEYPAVTSVKLDNPALNAFGKFKSELIPISVVGLNSVRVQLILDRVGYK
jgi:iron(III) transport system substrate-binding protein